MHQIYGRFLRARLIRYCIVGVLSTAVHVSMAFLFIYFVKPSLFFSNLFGFGWASLFFVNPALFFSNLFGFGWAYLFSYFFQSKFVFESNISFMKALKYFLVQFLSLVLAVGCSNAATEFNVYLKILLTAVILPLITFVVHKIWTFAGDVLPRTEN